MRQAGLPVLSLSQIQRRNWKRLRAAGRDEYFLGVRWTDAKLLRALRQLEKRYGYMSANLLDQKRRYAERALLYEAVWLAHRGAELGKITGPDSLADHGGRLEAKKRRQVDRAKAAPSGATPRPALSFGDIFARAKAARKNGKARFQAV